MVWCGMVWYGMCIYTHPAMFGAHIMGTEGTTMADFMCFPQVCRGVCVCVYICMYIYIYAIYTDTMQMHMVSNVDK